MEQGESEPDLKSYPVYFGDSGMTPSRPEEGPLELLFTKKPKSGTILKVPWKEREGGHAYFEVVPWNPVNPHHQGKGGGVFVMGVTPADLTKRRTSAEKEGREILIVTATPQTEKT